MECSWNGQNLPIDTVYTIAYFYSQLSDDFLNDKAKRMEADKSTFLLSQFQSIIQGNSKEC